MGRGSQTLYGGAPCSRRVGVGVGDDRVQRYCASEGIPIVLEIPDDRRVAEAYSRGELIVDALPDYREHFARLWQAIESHSAVEVTA